jgi:hypothetical protein
MQFNFVVSTKYRVVWWWWESMELVGRLPAAFDHPRMPFMDALVMWREL